MHQVVRKKLYIKVMCIIKVIIRVYLIEGVKSFAYKLYKLCLQAIIFQKWKGVGNFFSRNGKTTIVGDRSAPGVRALISKPRSQKRSTEYVIVLGSVTP